MLQEGKQEQLLRSEVASQLLGGDFVLVIVVSNMKPNEWSYCQFSMSSLDE